MSAAAPDLLDAIRSASARVMEHSRRVRVDEERLAQLCVQLAGAAPARAGLDPVHHLVGDSETTLAYVVTLDALNFGSGWFPELRKRPRLSGYYTVATGLKERFERQGAWSVSELLRVDAATCAVTFGQEGREGAMELMELFARALRDLGGWLERRWAGRFQGPIEAAGGSAARLVELLAEMPFYRDESRYAGFVVPFYKRAQLTAADLAAAFESSGPGAFDDLDRLTCFADNLVPHVLRREGVLVYARELGRRIDAGELLPQGSPEEVEIRAGAVHVVERCAQTLGGKLRPFEIDFLLWTRGQDPAIKAHPRHRTRTTFY